MTLSNGKFFRVIGTLWAEFTCHRWIHPQKPLTRSFGVFFDLSMNTRFSKQLSDRWFGMPSRTLWRNVNGWRRWRSLFNRCCKTVHWIQIQLFGAEMHHMLTWSLEMTVYLEGLRNQFTGKHPIARAMRNIMIIRDTCCIIFYLIIGGWLYAHQKWAALLDYPWSGSFLPINLFDQS